MRLLHAFNVFTSFIICSLTVLRGLCCLTQVKNGIQRF